ncbi:AcrR family transcriptional regulator [Paenibacillus endophyticus]|uniref:AcrR family transcriptional regulator n=1 Tax=Paenibacillus endophyticus TaxID=1294268 RepID=A0A7W5CE44_9BACL|nr:TetR/AcrR family transcriptional regulator [Paenibacillus endophyticus]MBB3155947.1 AcrR family transcriptional regulator [Paenibacillus endophyticus]
MNGYRQRTENKRKAIQLAALDLFASHGIAKVSLAEIAKKARVSPVTIYNYFGTKDALVKAVMIYFLEEEWRRQIELMQSDLPFHVKVKKLMFDGEEWTGKWNKEILEELLSNDEEWKIMVENVFEDVLPELMRFIETGKNEGYIDHDLSSNTILVYFRLLKEIKLTPIYKEVSTNTRMLEELSKIIFYGLLNYKIEE